MIEIIDGVEVKYCPRCEEYIPVSKFYKSNKSSDSFQSYCSDCARSNTNKWRSNNRDHVNQHAREWAENNREHVRQQAREYYKNNREYFCQLQREDYQSNLKLRRKTLFAAHLHYAIRTGKIIKPDECTLCGSTERIQGHHPSYESGHELDVVWVCALCHASIHIQLRREAESND